ncbi:hypothetical protein DXX93_17015 [Thalassotalea euphylliae]|uniref:Uncharacterized protein n=1 Tax=Thalassotalea euphylliae TaxID=1655234 RepID=A0A3E0TUH8_9GAMM|nr:hypothetical protein DXX93_17015 [Thalassotalea euphylliae]
MLECNRAAAFIALNSRHKKTGISRFFDFENANINVLSIEDVNLNWLLYLHPPFTTPLRLARAAQFDCEPYAKV